MSLNKTIKNLDLAHDNLYDLYKKDRSIAIIKNEKEIQRYYKRQYEKAAILTVDSEFVGNSFYNLDFINLVLNGKDIESYFKKKEKLFMKTHI